MNSTERLVLLVAILASFVAFLDGSVVNVALPAIARELGGGLSTQQWVVDAYLLTLGSLILLAGSLSDVLGRRRILELGLWGFGISSLVCAVAPNAAALIVARGVQGAAGALLVPSSLALIIATFKGAEQGKAIGRWTAWTGISFIAGPLVGGLLTDYANWRWVFAINVLPIAATLWLARGLAVEERQHAKGKIDAWGGLWCTLGLLACVYALIEAPRLGLAPEVIVAGLAGLSAFAAFWWRERTFAEPMLPVELFRVRNFSVGNAATFAIYGGLGVATFLLVVYLQQVVGYSALQAGLALIPTTLVMFVLSPRVGAWAGRVGPRWFMAAGPIVAAIGFVLLSRVGSQAAYFADVLPGILVFALGLVLTVSPLTAAVLADVGPGRAGIASAVNNAVARIAGLLATAAAGIVIGTQVTQAGFVRGALATAALLVVGGVVSAVGIINHPKSSVTKPA